MRLLYATTHQESIKVLKHHDISVYRSKITLGKDATDDVSCKIISTFLSPLFFHSDRLNALGSAHYCCDYEVLADLLPGGRISGREYVCALLQGGAGTSCSTNLETGKGSDFATGESWGDVIALAAKVWSMRQGEAALELAQLYHIDAEQNAPQALRQPAARHRRPHLESVAALLLGCLPRLAGRFCAPSHPQ